MFQPSPYNLNFDSDFVQASDPVALQAAVTTALAALVTANKKIVGMSLAGAGDGSTFTARLDYLIGTGTSVAGVVVECYEAANSDALKVAFEAASVAARTTGTLEVYDQLVAGSSQGTRFMGMVVLAPPGSFPSLEGSLAAGFGFPVGAANTPLAITAGHTFSADMVTATVAPVLDTGSSALFAQGTGADAGKLKYLGPSGLTAAVTMDVEMHDTGAGPDDVTLSVLKNGAAQNTSKSTATQAGISSVSVTSLMVLATGDLLDVSSDVAITVVKYHLTAERV